MSDGEAIELKTTLWATDRGVAMITLSRPESNNAWTGRMHTELRHLLERGENDPEIRVIVITGDPAGRTFCPGGDAKAIAGHAERGAYEPGTPTDLATPGYGVRPEFDADFAYLLGMSTVTVAAVNGATAGVGLALACWCDIRIIADNAKLTSAHGKLNLPAEYGLSWILPRIVGRGVATDILLTSRIVLGEEAGRIGLANQVVPTDDVMATALAYAHTLVETVSPRSLEATKRQLAVDAVHADPSTSVQDAQARLEAMMTEADYQEGAAALNERRPPRWTSGRN
ncbi:MAG: enoyl-CoA hydratase-related protein [Acidimicrobiales bacterium]|jgi:enoyl-CoA hydratase/carnithine racemase|nr:enoyl-CoA hydratase-related protein [Acidimicrobiales bacterium]